MEQTFGSYVREKRMARGLSLRALAAKLEVSPVYMSNIENDRRPAPTMEKPVSYTHLDVYKRQALKNHLKNIHVSISWRLFFSVIMEISS